LNHDEVRSCNSKRKGYKCSEETLNKLRSIKRSDEFKRKVSEGMKRYHARRRQE